MAAAASGAQKEISVRQDLAVIIIYKFTSQSSALWADLNQRS